VLMAAGDESPKLNKKIRHISSVADFYFED
jgi:hypothetical protein